MTVRPVLIGLVLSGLAFIASCQGSQPLSPTAPAAKGESPAAMVSDDPGSRGQGPLGAARLTVDRLSGDVTIAPLHQNAAIGVSFPIDATAYFAGDPCRDCMKLTSFSFAGDLLSLDMAVRHPFPSTTTRKDLDLFDPRVIVYAPSDPAWAFTTFDAMPPYLRPNPTGGAPSPALLSGNANFLINADGYTTRFDERIDFQYGVNYQGTLNPYLDYAKEVIPGDILSGENPWHRMGQTRSPETRTFQIFLPPAINVFEALFVIEASYGQSATKATRLTPTYYNPAFNRREAYNVRASVSAPSNGLAYLSNIVVNVAVQDWQEQSPIDLTYPNPANPTAIPQSSRVRDVTVALPGWTAAPVTLTLPASGLGNAIDPLIYTPIMPRTEVFPPRPGTILPLLVRVADEQDGQEISNVDPRFDLGRVYDVATYQILRQPINVVLQNITGEPVPGLILKPSGVRIRTAPFANSDEGTSEVEVVYPTGLNAAGKAAPAQMRLLVAGDDGHFSTVSPFVGAAALPRVRYADGQLPIDDYPESPDAHPSPMAFMPISSLGATPGGNFMAAFGDNNFTVNPIRFSTGITDLVPNSDIVRSWVNNGSTRLLGPRLSTGCGSDVGPTFGSRVRGVISAQGVTIGSRSQLLGFISAGLNTEACGDMATLTYYSAPYASEADRALTINLNQISFDLFGGIPTEPKFRALTRIVPLGYRPNTNQWFHAAFYQNRVVVFNALANFDPITRTSMPIVLFSRITGVETVIDLAYVPFDPTYPFVIGGTPQTSDWLLILLRGGLAGYRIVATQANNVAIQDASWLGSAPETWGESFPLISDMDFDQINRALILSYDDNGVSAGGEILTTLMITM